MTTERGRPFGRSLSREGGIITIVKLTKEDLKAIVDEIWSRLSAKLTGKADKDHTHPAQTSVTGNAGTATKLQTARTINGRSSQYHNGICL